MKNVTVLYADIVGFTNWSSNQTPTDIVGKLSELFKNFDLLCVKFNVYKVHTIGDCYVVLGINSKNIEER
jgi:phospholipid-translocating ATPase